MTATILASESTHNFLVSIDSVSHKSRLLKRLENKSIRTLKTQKWHSLVVIITSPHDSVVQPFNGMQYHDDQFANAGVTVITLHSKTILWANPIQSNICHHVVL